MYVAVTGGAGLVGQAVLQELIDHGYRVKCIDQKRPARQVAPICLADLTHLGETVEALKGVDAVIHLAAIASSGTYTDGTVYATNTRTHFHVLKAAEILGIQKVVTASSIQVVTQINTDRPVMPLYLPMDENHPCIPANSYGLSKEVGEATDRFFARRGMQVLSFRFAWVTSVEHIRQMPPERGTIPDFWTYVDYRDAAMACRLGIEAEGLGWEPFYITAADSVRHEPTLDLVKKHYPGVERRPGLEGHRSCIKVEKAEAMLGYRPRYSWRSHLS